MTASRTGPPLDRARVRAHARRLDGVGLRVWLDRAIDLLPEDALPQLVVDYVHPGDLVADGQPEESLLDAIHRFHRESLAGEYYQEFAVNSRNCMEFSRGTELFIAEHARLVDACLKAERAGDLDVAREGLGLLLDILRRIDRFDTDIVFFADEAGAWQVGVHYPTVLPAWFRTLSPALEPEAWAATVLDAIAHFGEASSDDILAAARELATAPQREALTTLGSAQYRRP